MITKKYVKNVEQEKRGCVACKKELAKNIIDTLEPIREKRKYYEAHPEEVDKVLIEGTKKQEKLQKKQ